jgi:Phage capsid protein
MSQQLSAIAQTEFDSQVKGAYQNGRTLRGCVRVKSGIVGSSAVFYRATRGQATPRVPQTDVRPMNTGYGQSSATIGDWNAAEYTDVFDQQKTKAQERPIVAANIAGAIGRREDQMILDALDTANASANVDTNVGGSTTGANMAKLRRAKRIMDDRAVPQAKRKFVHSTRFLEDLLGATEVTSADFNSIKALINAELPKFVGFEYLMIETRAEGGLPLASNLRTNYAFDSDAVGLAIGIEQKTEVNYIPEKTSWLANGLFAAGAAVIDAEGVIEVSTTEA